MTADVIKGPWKKIDKTEKELEKAQLLAECDSIASDCMVAVLQNLVENGMAPEDPDDENIAYMMFLSEMLKSVTYANVEVHHPFQDIIRLLTGSNVLIDNTREFYIDYDSIARVIEHLQESEPEKDPA
jgi:hypothetical protein